MLFLAFQSSLVHPLLGLNLRCAVARQSAVLSGRESCGELQHERLSSLFSPVNGIVSVVTVNLFKHNKYPYCRFLRGLTIVSIYRPLLRLAIDYCSTLCFDQFGALQ